MFLIKASSDWKKPNSISIYHFKVMVISISGFNKNIAHSRAMYISFKPNFGPLFHRISQSYKRKLVANRIFFQLQKDWANLDKLALRYCCFTAAIFLPTIFSKLQPCDHSNSSNQFTTNLKAIQSSNHPIQFNYQLKIILID